MEARITDSSRSREISRKTLETLDSKSRDPLLLTSKAVMKNVVEVANDFNDSFLSARDIPRNFVHSFNSCISKQIPKMTP